MLVLARKKGERVMVGRNVEVVVLEVHRNRVKLGISGPDNVPIHRKEVYHEPAPSPTGDSFLHEV